MSAYAAHDHPGHAAEDGMIATLGLLPGTWIGEVQASTLREAPCAPQRPSASKSSRPRQATFRGCWRSFGLRRFAGKHCEAKRGATASKPKLERREMHVEQDTLKEWTELCQEAFTVELPLARPRPPSSLRLPAAAQSPTSILPYSKSANEGPVPKPPPLEELPALEGAGASTIQRRPGSSASRPGSRAAACKTQTTPKGRAATPKAAYREGLAKAKVNAPSVRSLSAGAPRSCDGEKQALCGLGQVSHYPARKQELVKAVKSVADVQTTMDEAALWELCWPQGAAWGKTKKLPKWDFCRVTGPWSNRMRSGSFTNYKQWGPDGPLWNLEDVG